MWVNDTLRLLGAKFKGAGIGYGWYEHTLPNGDVIAVNHREEWIYLDQRGLGSESLFQLAFPRVQAWREAADAKAQAAKDARYQKAVDLLTAITAHLNAIDWTCGNGSMVLKQDAIGPYPNINITDGTRAEIWVEFHDDGSVRTASVGSKHCSGLPSIRKQAEKYYEFK